MNPSELIDQADKNSQTRMAPPYSDDNAEMDLTERGMRIADNEARDAVVEAYEKQALTSDEPETHLNSIDYPVNEIHSEVEHLLPEQDAQ